MATDVISFIEGTLRAIGTLLGATEADAVTDGLFAVAIAVAALLILGSWFLRPGALDWVNRDFDPMRHDGDVGGNSSGCGCNDGGCGD